MDNAYYHLKNTGALTMHLKYFSKNKSLIFAIVMPKTLTALTNQPHLQHIRPRCSWLFHWWRWRGLIPGVRGWAWVEGCTARRPQCCSPSWADCGRALRLWTPDRSWARESSTGPDSGGTSFSPAFVHILHLRQISLSRMCYVGGWG